MRTALLYIITFLIFTSCKKDVGSVNYGNYPAAVGKIIGNKCATSGCHNSKSFLAASGLNLETWLSMFGGSNSGSAVIPYNSKFSSLCGFINTYEELGIQNTPVMPLNNKKLSYDEVKLIKHWIDDGAPDLNGNVMWGDNPLRKKLYAVNQGCDVITVFDSETQLPIRYIEVGRPGIPDTPHQVRVSPDGKYWYVIFVTHNVMEKHRCSDDAFVANIPLTPLAAGTGQFNIGNWNTFIISKDSKRAYCVSLSSYISAVDLENEKLIHSTNPGGSPHASVLNADNTKLYIGSQYGNFITEWDTSLASYNDIALDALPVGSNSLWIHDMILSPNQNDLFITCQKSNEVRVYNIPTSTVTAVIPVGVTPQEIVYSSSVNQYFVSCPEDTFNFHGFRGVISKINAAGYAEQKIQCGYQPHGIGVDENKKLLYVLSRNLINTGPAPHHTSECGRNGFVNFIDLKTFTPLTKKYEMSSDPYFIFARP